MKKTATIFGIVLLAAGILGFVPPLTPDGKLLGLFAVNGVHNAIHIATGLAAIAAGAASEHAARMFFRIFGVVYALVAVLGMIQGDQPLLGIVAHNTADMWLHVAIAAFALYCGFAHRRDTPRADRGSGPNLRGA
jgi:hypothetical protein